MIYLIFLILCNINFLLTDDDFTVDELFSLNQIEPLKKIEEWPFQKKQLKELNNTFDFIIVGSGPGGSVVANRLSENPNFNVIVLEAGIPETFFSTTPGNAGKLVTTAYNWGYFMNEEPNICQAMVNKRCRWPRGYSLGGSSAINTMLYSRGNPEDFQIISSMGLPEWTWDKVFPYFLKSEDALLKHYQPKYHNYSGLLSIQNVPYQTKLLGIFKEAGIETGRPYIDINGKTQFGFDRIQTTTRNGRRCSASKAFLYSAAGRPNLFIKPNTLVTKVLFDTNKKAIGVQAIAQNKTVNYYAKKEVILSAGIIGSAQILLLSGIGPENDLKNLNIPVIKNLGTGQFLKDHVAYFGLVFTISKDYSIDSKKQKSVESVLKFIWNREGPLTSAGTEALGFFKSSKYDKNETRPNIELQFFSNSIVTDDGQGSGVFLNVRPDFYKSEYGEISGQPSWTIYPIVLHPKSIGYLKLKSASIYDHPILHGNYFQHPDDKGLLIEGIKEVIRISKTKAFQSINSTLYDKPFSQCKQYPMYSDEYWGCAVSYMGATFSHQIGTCRMGTSEKTGVVNSRLQVFGVTNLRVIDVSILPEHVCAHTQSTSYMIGEKGADFIKQDWS